MASISISSGRYTYFHDEHEGTIQAVDIHDVYIARSKSRVLILSFSLFLISCRFLFLPDIPGAMGLWILLLTAMSLCALRSNQVKKESAVIMPTFGVQLEVHYWSGKVTRHFVPLGQIVKPVLNECVTPVTCYWSLALILRDEDQLMLVFQKSRLPIRILIPIWKALCAVVEAQNTSTGGEVNFKSS